MNNKTFRKIKRHINKSIKVGGNVYIIDGSGLALTETNDHEDMYIVFDYPDVTGSKEILKDIVGEVTTIGIKDVVTDSVCNSCHGVDIIVRLGDAEFYTCSQFVRKIE